MNKTSYNEIIKAARKAKGLTQKELAEQAEVSLRTIQRIEKGTEEISGYSLKQISKILNIPLEQIIKQNVNQISTDSNQIESIRNLYLMSLFFIINPILGLLVPYIIGNSKQNRSELYNIHLKKISKYHGFYLLFMVIIFIILIFSFVLNDSNKSYIIESTNSDITAIVTAIDYKLFFWQLIIILTIFYIPTSLIWTFLQFRKLIRVNKD